MREMDVLRSLTDTINTHLGSGHVVLTDGGTSALRLAIELLTPPGKPVALPAFGCFDLITAAQGAQRRVLCYDVDPRTLGPSLDSLEAVIHAGAGSLVIASLYGYAPPMQALVSLAEANGIPLIEDAAQAAGARSNDRTLGTWGDAAVYSFGRGKGVGGGGGGALVLRDFQSMTPDLEPPSKLADIAGLARLALQQILQHPAVFAIPSAIPALGLGKLTIFAPVHPSQSPPFRRR